MSSIRIQDLQEVTPIDAMKIPTGGFGDVSVTIEGIFEHFKLKNVFATKEALDSHVNNKNNPHQVTKAQVGLDRVNNTNDLEKPISNATQIALDKKADTVNTYTKEQTNNLLAEKANDSDVYKKEEVYTKEEVDTKVDSVSGGYFKAFNTLSELQAATGMTQGQVAKVMNDPNPDNNGDYFYDGSSWVKGYDSLTASKNFTIAYTEEKVQEEINNNIPLLPSNSYGHIWTMSEQVAMFMTSSGVLNIPAGIETDAFRTEDGNPLQHVMCDKNGQILAYFGQDGSFEYLKKPLDYYKPQEDYRQYFEIDKLKNQNTQPYFFEKILADYGTDGKLHQRMGAAIRVSTNRIFVSFSQFNTANTDAVNSRLVGRFVDFDLVNKTATVDTNTIVMRDTQNTAIASRHPNLIKLKDGRYMCLYNETLRAGVTNSPLYAIYSTDCITWSAPVLKLIDNNDNFAFTAPVTIQRIHTGKYKDRLIFPIYNASFQVRLVYSDDEGETWQAGEIWSGANFGDSALQTNESNLVIDVDGSVIVHSRTDKNSTGNRYFYIVKSSDGGQTIDVIGKNDNFVTANCAIGMAQAAQNFKDGVPKILSSRPTSLDQYVRNKFMISVSYDGMRTSQYNYKPFSDDVNVGYTHLLPLDDQNFVLVMEKGTEINNGNNYMTVAFFNIKEVMNNG